MLCDQGFQDFDDILVFWPSWLCRYVDARHSSFPRPVEAASYHRVRLSVAGFMPRTAWKRYTLRHWISLARLGARQKSHSRVRSLALLTVAGLRRSQVWIH